MNLDDELAYIKYLVFLQTKESYSLQQVHKKLIILVGKLFGGRMPQI